MKKRFFYEMSEIYEKVLVLQVLSKSRSIFCEKSLFFFRKWGELYEQVQVLQLSSKSRSIFFEKSMVFLTRR